MLGKGLRQRQPPVLVMVGDGEDNSVRLWNATTGQAMGSPLVGHTKAVTSVAAMVHPLEHRLLVASGSRDRTLRVWDGLAGTPIALVPHTGEVRRVALAPHPQGGHPLVVSAMEEDCIRVWDAVSGDPIGSPLVGNDDIVTRVTNLAVDVGQPGASCWWSAAGGTGAMRMWDGLSGTEVRFKDMGFDPDAGALDVTSVAVGVHPALPGPHSDGCRASLPIAFGYKGGTVRVWDLVTGKPVGAPLVGHADDVTSVAVGARGGQRSRCTSAGGPTDGGGQRFLGRHPSCVGPGPPGFY